MADSWAVKWRPQDFKSLNGNTLVGEILRNAVKHHQEPPAAFFAGTRGSGKCIDKNSLLLTLDGLKRACDIFPAGEWKAGDFIEFKYPLVNMKGEIEYTSYAYYNGVEDCIKFTSLHDLSITCTKEHPLYVYNIKTQSFGWREARNIQLEEDCFCLISDQDKQLDKMFYMGEAYYTDPIISAELVKDVETVDFTMPETHSFIANGIVSHNTTSARIYAKAICCEHPKEDGEPCNECDSCKDIANRCYPDVIEVDAASENSVQGIRDLVKTLNYLPTRGDKKVIIIDECLTCDTLILMEDGSSKKICDVHDGDYVMAFNFETGFLVPKPVSGCFNRYSEKIIQVCTEFGYVKGSPTHQMRSRKSGMINYFTLEELEVGDELVLMDYYGSMKNGPIYEKIIEIRELPGETVYDFEVEEFHTFIANGFVSHNCHSLSQAATNALLKTLEEPPEFVRFVFCTTEPQKVLETIRSRCLMFRFNDITSRDIVSRLRYIADNEGVNIDDAALMAIAKNSNGGMRDAIMLLEQAFLANVSDDMIKPSNILELVGSVSVRDIQKLFMSMKSGDQQQLLEWLDQEKFAPIDILNSSISFLETIVLIKQGVSPAEFVSKDLVAGVMSLASTISFHDVTVMFEEFRGIIYDLRSLNGVSTAALFKLRLLGVIDKLTYQPAIQAGSGVSIPQQKQSFLQLVKAEFNVERIPLPV